LRRGGKGQAARERERVGSVCSSVRFVEEREKKRESMQPGAERQAAPACLTGRRDGRSGRLPDVEERGATSAGNAGGGRRDKATRGARCRGRRAAGRCSGPGGGGVHAAEEETERSPGLGKTKRTRL
jgi:hypothetical protein